VITGFYLLVFFLFIFGLPEFIDYLAEKIPNSDKLRLFKKIIYNFPDIWQNISFAASARYFIKIIPGILIIILVTNEYNYLTIRSNIYSGMSRGQFLMSKILFILMIAFLSTLLLFLSGLYLGLTQSITKEFSMVFSKMEFLAAYFLEFTTFLAFCLMTGIIIRKAGPALIVLFLYFMIEPILEYKLSKPIGSFLPLKVMNHVITSPNTSLIKIKTPEFNFNFQETLSFASVSHCVIYLFIFILISYLIIKKRDL